MGTTDVNWQCVNTMLQTVQSEPNLKSREGDHHFLSKIECGKSIDRNVWWHSSPRESGHVPRRMDLG